MSYYLRVYDNFHYGNIDEAYDHGCYPSYQSAAAAAEDIVDEFLNANYKEGMTADELMTLYISFGEDPDVMPDEPGDVPRFSARKYARQAAETKCSTAKREADTSSPEKTKVTDPHSRRYGRTLNLDIHKISRYKRTAR